jgi:cold shock CspA family protein
MLRGRIKFFDDRRGFGQIRPSIPIEPGKDFTVFIHRKKIDDPEPILFDGEEVEFAAVKGPKGYEATYLRRLSERYEGIVDEWLLEKGTGFIKDPEGTDRVFVSYHEIKCYGPRNLEVGETVTFGIENDRKGRRRAINVLVFQSRFAIERYANIDELYHRDERMLKHLADLAQPEDWSYHNTEADGNFPVLEKYIIYTFDRLMKEGKIIEGVTQDDRPIACFNTGLATSHQQEIIGYFVPNRVPKDPRKWYLQGFAPIHDIRFSRISPEPEIANYFADPSDLLYDSRLNLRCDVPHIIEENKNRFPEEVRENSYLLNQMLIGAVEIAKKRVRRNYKTAIPNFYRGRMQLLLPLCLKDPSVAELALVVSREGEVYQGWTVLTLDMAYNNARLIARPDREWLQP